MIRVVLVDDQLIIRVWMKDCISEQPDMEVVGQATNGIEAIKVIEQLRPNVVLMGVRMPKPDGVEVTKHVRSTCPEVNILFFTASTQDRYVLEGLRAGAVDYLDKGDSEELILQAIRAAAEGRPLYRRCTSL